MRNKRLCETLPVRLPVEVDKRIRKVAEAAGLSRSDALRMAINHGLPEIEAGRLNLNNSGAAK